MFHTKTRGGRQFRHILPALLLAGMAAWSGLASATPGSGATVFPISQATTEGSLKIRTEDASDIINQRITLAPGGTTGWHSHPGYHLVSVTAGMLTVYDDECQSRTYGPGQAVLHRPGDVHLMRNDGEDVVETYFTLILPAETQQPRIDDPAPAACPDVS